MLEWIIIIFAIAAALAYLGLRLARWMGVRRCETKGAKPSRPQGITVGGRRVR